MTFPDPAVLEQELEAIYFDHARQWTDARPKILAQLKAARAASVEALAQSLETDGSGTAAAKTLARGQDAIITALYAFTKEHLYPTANPSVAERLSVVATGGYGRGLLAPGSDIDLLFLYPYRPTPWTESMVELMLYLLWDMGLKVGHAARSVDECVKLARGDFTIRTALLECRHVTGDPDLSGVLRERFDQAVVRGSGKKFIAAKLEERDERHRRQGRSRYLVEPNVKEGKGGLRDLNTLFWIAKYYYRVTDEADLVDKGVFSAAEYRLFNKCDDFLWAVRCHLHLVAGRAEERLTFEFQREIADRLGYITRPGLSAVERFMKHYFLVAKDVGDLTRILCAALEAQHVVPQLGLSRLVRTLTFQAPIPLDGDFREANGRIVLTRHDAFHKDPLNYLRVFEAADRHNLRPHPDTLAAMRRSIRSVDEKLRTDPEANRIFLHCLCDSDDPERLLRLMNEAGVLGAFVPDFGRVVAMMQFNMYHHYTVDEHLIRTVGILSAIERGRLSDTHPLASRLIGTIRNRRALYVASFLHDIAKGRPKDHSVEGARLARKLCPRFGLSAPETELVAWLIEEHLVMSITAQSRDLSDPKTIDLFASRVQSFERLKLLEILTEADIAAVGPNVWNGWKSQLLSTLYDATDAIIASDHTRMPRSKRVEAAQRRFLEEAPLPEPVRRNHVERFPAPYWIRNGFEAAVGHANLIEGGDPGSVLLATHFPADGAGTQMTLAAPDRPKLLSVVAAACASCQANVVSADIFTSNDGIALDVFTLTPFSDEPDDEIERVERIARLVRAALLEDEDIPGATAYRLRAAKVKAFHHATDVLIANDWSNRYTAIEVSGLDRPGLFRDLARTLRKLSLHVRSAQVATFGERVVDVFYVTDEADEKVTDDARQHAIKDALRTAYDRTHKRPGRVRAQGVG
ncbi:MAG: [protein-PII] uridylyltransferase [Pseudomonadota bacterium]